MPTDRDAQIYADFLLPHLSTEMHLVDIGCGDGHFAGSDLERAGAFLDVANDPGFDADWWGTYHWSGVAGPWTTCPTCS